MQLEKKSGDLANLNKDLSKEEIESNNVFSLSENKHDSEIRIISDFETEGNVINVEKTNSSNSDDVFALSENKCDSEMESIMSDTEERSEFRILEPILRMKMWKVSKANICNIFDLKTHKLLGGWYNIVYDDFISKHNPYCVLVFRRTHVKKKNSIRKNSPLFRTRATCKHSTCKTTHIFTICET